MKIFESKEQAEQAAKEAQKANFGSFALYSFHRCEHGDKDMYELVDHKTNATIEVFRACKECYIEEVGLLAAYADVYGWKKTDRSSGASFALDCSFWSTPYEDLYVTDYDHISQTKREDTLAFYVRGVGIEAISKEMLDDKEYMGHLMAEHGKKIKIRAAEKLRDLKS